MTAIMLAPNGGRRGRAEHPAIPITIHETAACAAAAREQGADAIHAHLRDADGGHLLDAGAYRELIAEIGRAAPGLAVQITTEAVGRYKPTEQMQVVRDVQPAFASCALREFEAEPEAAARFYHEMAEAGVGLQHILYEPGEAVRLATLRDRGAVPGGPLSVIFVVGSYPDGGGTPPARLAEFVAGAAPLEAQWMACAFGTSETRVLTAAMALGGHARVGFENALVMADGSPAPDNAARVQEVAALRSALDLHGGDAAAALGARS